MGERPKSRARLVHVQQAGVHMIGRTSACVLLRLNVGALTRLTYAAVPGFIARGGGTIINIASIVAISPETLNGVYGGSKAFVLALSQSLHHELASRRLRVQAVLPGARRSSGT